MLQEDGETGALGEKNVVKMNDSRPLPLLVEVCCDAVPGTEQVGLEEDGEDEEEIEEEDDEQVDH